MISRRGFTLIELLVVIAIIGILSSIVLTELGDARGKARYSTAFSTLRGVLPVLQVCLDSNSEIYLPAQTPDGQFGAPFPICPATDTYYPTLPSGWTYCNDDSFDDDVCYRESEYHDPLLEPGEDPVKIFIGTTEEGDDDSFAHIVCEVIVDGTLLCRND